MEALEGHQSIQKIIKQTETSSPVNCLKLLAEEFPGRIAFSTSFGEEDQVITDMIFRHRIPIRVFSIDTGRLFEETYKVMNRTNEKYNQKIQVYFPDFKDIEKLVNEKGPNCFYESIDNRKACCHIRKVIPLNRALENVDCWITGLRAGQSSGRKELQHYTYDENFHTIKYNPLLSWSLEEVKKYIRENQVPYNALHDRNYVSIGCAPCTRATLPGEDIRAGRWWWENNSGKECGLHDPLKK